MKKTILIASSLLVAFSACHKKDRNTTLGTAPRQDSISYYDINAGKWYYQVDPFINCSIDQFSSGYRFDLQTSGINSDDTYPGFSLWFQTDEQSRNTPIGGYSVPKGYNNSVEENPTKDKYGKIYKYNIESGTVKLTEASSDKIRGEYTLVLRNTSDNTTKSVAGQFVNYDPE